MSRRSVGEGNRPFTCPECDSQFNRSYHLKRHLTTVHRGEKSFMCPECQYCFGHASSLKRHVATVHRGERPFSCSICGYSCAQASHLKNHLHTIHRVSNVGFKSDEFDSAASPPQPEESAVVLTMKKVSSKNLKPFACSQCDFRCGYGNVLKRHERATHAEAGDAVPVSSAEITPTYVHRTKAEPEQHEAAQLLLSLGFN